jgi:hypothetical protein
VAVNLNGFPIINCVKVGGGEAIKFEECKLESILNFFF